MSKFVLFNEEDEIYLNKDHIVSLFIQDIEDEDGEIAFVVIAQMDVMNNYKIIKNINIDEDEDSGKNHSHLLNPDHMIANSEFFATYEEAEKFLNTIIKD